MLNCLNGQEKSAELTNWIIELLISLFFFSLFPVLFNVGVLTKSFIVVVTAAADIC